MKGIGVMLGELFGNASSADAFKAAMGKKMTALDFSETGLIITLEDGYKVRLFDDGQSCCETRYMNTDADIAYYVGAVLTGARVQDAPCVQSDADYGDEHEMAFLIVETSLGEFTIETHNIHNGYYGGFLVRCEVVE